MPRYPGAIWRGPVPNKTPEGIDRPILWLALHIEQGTEDGTNSWFHNPGSDVSAHFGNKRGPGKLDQWVNTNGKAWAEVAGNSRTISVEHEGISGEDPTHFQVQRDAELLAWLHETEGLPLQRGTVDKDGLHGKPGVVFHSQGGDAWGNHPDCPGKGFSTEVVNTIICTAKALVRDRAGRNPHHAAHVAKNVAAHKAAVGRENDE